MSLTVIHKSPKYALVKSNRTGKAFPVQMQDWLKNLVSIGDIAKVVKSPVSGEWIMTDYISMWGE